MIFFKKNKNKIIFIILLFMICSVIGYIYEEILFLITKHKFVDRGYLYGPYLPIYGYGGVLVYLLFNKFKRNPLIIFLFSSLTCGGLELIVGFLLKTLQNKRLWNYKGHFLNIGGFVCLSSVIAFGVGGLCLIYILIPLLKKLMFNVNKNILKIICLMFIFVFIIDHIFCIIYK